MACRLFYGVDPRSTAAIDSLNCAGCMGCAAERRARQNQ
jgi:hypothetical protein